MPFPAGGTDAERPALRAALLQFEAVHEECIPALVHGLRANGVEPTIYVNDRIRDARGDIGSLFPEIGTVNYRPFHSPADWNALQAEVASYDLMVVNTFQREGVANWLDVLGKPVLGVVHNPKVFLERPRCTRLVREGRAGIVTLAPHVTAWMMQQAPRLYGGVGTITSIFPQAPIPPTPGERRRLSIPGAVNFAGRNYPDVVAAIPALLADVDRASFEIAVVGGGADRPELERMVQEAGYDDLFSFAPLDSGGFVETGTYYKALAQSSFILPVLPELRADFRTHKITSAVPVSIGIGVPSVVDRWTATVYGAPAVTYPAGQLALGLRDAVRLDSTDLARLRDRVEAFRQQSLASSAEQIGEVLGRLLDRPAGSVV